MIPFGARCLRKQLDKCLRKDVFCQAEELCKWVLQKALFYAFVFQTHNELFSGAHATLLGNWDLSAGRVA